MNALRKTRFDPWRILIGYVIAAGAGFLALYAMVLAWSYVSYLIEPTARISAFLMRPLRHPVRLEIAGVILHATLGTLAGAGLFFLARWIDHFNQWLLWLVFAAGFIGSISAMTHGPGSWPMMALLRIGIFLAAAAASLALASRQWSAQPIKNIDRGPMPPGA